LLKKNKNNWRNNSRGVVIVRVVLRKNRWSRFWQVFPYLSNQFN
jgi:hypothetical protein